MKKKYQQKNNGVSNLGLKNLGAKNLGVKSLGLRNLGLKTLDNGNGTHHPLLNNQIYLL